MPFGIDDVIFILSTIAAQSFADSKTDLPTNEIPGGLAGGSDTFALPQTPTTPPGEVVADPGPAVDLQASSDVVSQIAQVLASRGPAPTVPLVPSQIPLGPPGSTAAIPAAADAPPAAPQAAQAPKGASIGEVLRATPEALQSVASLLGIGPQEGTRQIAAPIPGGTVGNLVPGFNLPTTQGIGQLLAQIPRLG